MEILVKKSNKLESSTLKKYYDSNLTWKEIGLLILLLTKDKEVFTLSEISKMKTDGKTAIQNILKSLKNKRYCFLIKEIKSNKKMYLLFTEPQDNLKIDLDQYKLLGDDK